MLNIYEFDEARTGILKRAPLDEFPLTDAMRRRTIETFGADIPPEEVVRRILKDVRLRGDAALVEWGAKLDGVEVAPDQFDVLEEDVAAAYDMVDSEVVAAFERAADRIQRFHARNPAQSWWETSLGGVMGQLIRPLERVGVYVPGGSAPLASTLLMTAIVARQAGVEEVIVCSPPGRALSKLTGRPMPHPTILVAADIAGVDMVYAVGGVPAIGAMAYGTGSIDKVDKICGPGNAFVVLAKKQVFGVVGIDSLPGPTETVIVADDSANPAWVAADMLAQAEHVGGTAILLTPSRRMAMDVGEHLDEQIGELALIAPANAAEIRASFGSRSGAVITEDVFEAVALADEFAPEHLCLSVAEPWAWVGKIRNAGGVFVGEHSYEVLGDYCAGPSHTMPTGGTARFAPPCNVLDFVRVMNVIGLDATTARELGPVAVKMAQAEGLHAHASAARRRTP